MARELVSRVQQLRREAGLAVSDRISVDWATDDERLAGALDLHGDYIRAEVLATAIARLPVDPSGSGSSSGLPATFDVDGVPVGLRIDKV